MLKNYIKIAFRNLKKHPLFTTINIMGLAIGIVGSALISLFIVDELSYDTMFLDADRMYRIDTDIKFGGAEMKASQASAPMAAAMKNDFPEVVATVRFRDRGELLIRDTKAKDNTKGSDATYVDDNFFSFFGVKMIEGDSKTALKDVNTIVLTKTVAKRVFNRYDVLGETVRLNDKYDYKVTGVIEDLPANSFLKNHGIFMSMSSHPDAKSNLWGSMNYFTYVKLKSNASLSAFNKKVAGMLETYMLPWAQKVMPGLTPESFAASGDYIHYYAVPFKDIYLHSDREQEMSATGNIKTIYILTAVGFFLVFLACVNFMNLSTAQSLKRAKEIGIRKTLGSNKSGLIKQFLSESLLITVMAMVIALGLMFLLLPSFNKLADKAIVIPFTNPLFWLVVVVATFLLGLISGSYPAFFMSGFKPTETLKGKIKNSLSGGGVRNGLVVFQFAVSVVLIIGTLVVFKQLKFIQNKDMGFNREQVLLIDNAFSAGSQLEAFKTNVDNLSAVKSSTLSSQMPTPSDRSNSTFFLEGKTNSSDALQMQEWGVDHNYTSTLGLEFVAGRNFDKSITTDKNAVIINEANLKTLGMTAQEALGKRFYEAGEEGTPKLYTIIGVVKNFHYEPLREKIRALAMFLAKSTGMMAIKLNTEDYAATISQLEILWKKHAPGQPFDYSFMDKEFDRTYAKEHRIGSILGIFTSLSIFIASLGLFGLAIFNAQQRFKEIGVRKVLGASVSQITFKLIVDFLKLVAISALIALPVGWYLMHQWLLDFSYRTSVGWEVLVMSAVFVIIIAVITVGFQAIKAATVNPIKSLKAE